MIAAFYMFIMLLLNILLAIMDWGCIYLSLVIVITYLTFRPTKILHPNNMLFGFFGLYIVLPSTLSLILHLISWDFVIPWAEDIQWNLFSRYVLFQAEFTFIVLYFGIHFFSRLPTIEHNINQLDYEIKPKILFALSLITLILIFWFIEVTAGLDSWLNDYSFTYLTRRMGHGFLNVVTIAFGNLIIFLLGLKTYQTKKKFMIVVLSLFIISALSFIGGIKARFIFLLILFLSPWMMSMKLTIMRIGLFSVTFFCLLYLGTLLRTEGFYASPAAFMEMLIGYFNSYQLHDYVVVSRDPDLFQTSIHLFIKPLQLMGFVHEDADFDLSVMLTKEFFPEHWYNERATDQWPLDTELYLNYYGFWLSWLPLLIYAAFISSLYRMAILQANLFLLPIYVMEFQRIFSMMRGTLIPWEFPIYVVQYLFIYYLCKVVIQPKILKSSAVEHA